MDSNETVKKLIHLFKSLTPSISTPSLLSINQPNRVNINLNDSDLHINSNHTHSNNSNMDVDNHYNKYNKLKKNAYSLTNFATTNINVPNDINLDDLEKTLMTTSKVFYKRKSGTSQSALTIQTILFILIGVFIGFYLATSLRKSILNCKNNFSCCSNSDYDSLGNKRSGDSNRNDEDSTIKIYKDVEPDKNLVFIGVMTAQKYLDTRAKSVFKTWGRFIPGKMSFFSRSGSSSAFNLPLVSLPGVDDSYPPQKKSFMMLKFMHDNYLDKFEWFMRVDDDVYIKPDKLENFLRSLNSSIPQFIGQAGLGNKDEFGLLSLDYDENFCMGGPGIILSRETLRLVVPHISYCLKNLYSTHEDVEIGRCIRKFANISCTWSYEMQHIFHHNSSGNNAFTGDLLSREVLRAISLHPIKRSQYQYRLHNFMNLRKIIDLRQRFLFLKREVFKLKTDLLNIDTSNSDSTLTTTTTTTNTNTSSTTKPNELDEIEIDSDFDNYILNKNENLNREHISNRFNLPPSLQMLKSPQKRDDRHDFDFFTRSLFSSAYISPKRGLEGFWKNSLVDTVRQIMEEINHNSIERGRLIDFKDILYGYTRHHPLVGLDYIIDILLVYRKYEGRKMTVPVRRHAYVRNTYTNMFFREDDLKSSIYVDVPHKYRLINQTDDSSTQELSSEPSTQSQNNPNVVRRLIDAILPDFMSNQNENEAKNNEKIQKDGKLTLVDSNLAKALSDYDQEFYIDKTLSAKTINFVLPLTGRWEIFQRFMKNYENVCLRTKENTRLAIVLFENEFNGKDLILDESLSPRPMKQSELIRIMFDKLKSKYASNSLQLIMSNLNFSRSIGCELGAAEFAQDQLIFFVDVDIMFTNEFLLRARLNTIEYKQVYYPIVYSEYDPDETIEAIRVLSTRTETQKRAQKLRDSHFDFDLDSGYWRQFGFGIVAVYNSDLRRVGGFDTSIIGWGKEDVDLFEKFIKSNLTLFRSVDPGLVHIFHKIECDPNLAEEQMIMCMGSKSTSIASQKVLANLIYDRKMHLIEPKLEITTVSFSNATNNNNNNKIVNKNKKIFPIEKPV